MPHHPPITAARHTQGLTLYRGGGSLRDMMKTINEIEEMHKLPNLTDEQHNEIQSAAPSVILGFADGLIEDIRLIAAARRVGRRA